MPNFFDQFDPSAKPEDGAAPRGNYFDQFEPGYKPPEQPGDFMRGAKVALGQTVPILKGVAGLAGATAESALGDDTMLGKVAGKLKNWGLEGYTAGMEKLQPLQKDTDELTTAWSKAKDGDIGALLDWVQYGLGYAVGQGGEALLTSLIGGTIGGAASGGLGAAPGAIVGLVGKGAVKDVAATLIQKAVLKEANQLVAQSAGRITAEEAVKAATKSVAKEIGSTSAMLAYGTGQELGSIYPEAEAQAAKEGRKLSGSDLARVWGSGLAAGGIEGLTDRLGVQAALGKINLGGSSRLGNAVRGGVGGVLVEGTTEGVQTAIEHYGAGQPIADEAGIKDIINSAGLGAVGGAGIGGGAGLLHGGQHGDPAAVARSNQALDDIAAAPDGDAAIEAFQRTHIPLTVPKNFDADGAMARMERANANDENMLRDRTDSMPAVVTPLGAGQAAAVPAAVAAAVNSAVAPATVAPTDATPSAIEQARTAAQGTPPTAPERIQAGVPETFADRLAVVREKLQDSRTRQQIRDLSGSQALGDALYFAKSADDDTLPGKTSDQMLRHAERLLNDAGVPELPRQITAAAKAQTMAEKRAAIDAKATEKKAAADAPAPAEPVNPAADAPATPAAASMIDERAHEAAASPTNPRAEPTNPQAEAGNYKKGHDSTTFPGLDLSIENPEGSTRRDSKNVPPKWEHKMAHHYGYIKGTKSIDGEHMDVFVKPGTPEGHQGPVFIVDQIVPGTGKPDEHKVMLGFDTLEAAKEAYHANYPKDWKGLRTISASPFAEFKQWLATGDTSKPFHQPTLAERVQAAKERTSKNGEKPSAPTEVTTDKPTPEVAAAATPQPESTVTTPPTQDSPDPGAENSPVDLGPTVKHTTGKGKELHGWVLQGATDAEARAIDAFTFKKDGGYFIREKHQDALEAFERSRVGATKVAGEGEAQASKRPAGETVAAPAAPEPTVTKDEPAVDQTALGEGVGEKPLADRVQAAKDRTAPAAPATLTSHFADIIQRGEMPKDNPALRKLVEAFDGKPATQARMKEAQEALESAIVQAARAIVAKNARAEGPKTTFAILLRLYQSQPNLNIRTSTSVENQAYSTPAPLAFLASELAGITKQTTVLEPTAGTGMLLIGADPNKVIANELNPARVALLREQGFAKVTDRDATERVTPLTVDRVIANPPFGPLGTKVKVDGYTIGQIDHLIAARALEAMKDDGRATLILGANKVAGGVSNQDLIFFNWLYGNYNVTSHFEVEGDLYARQGAGWPVRVITIEGREKSAKVSPAAGVIQRAATWDEVYELFEQGLATGRAGRGLPTTPVSSATPRPNDAQPVSQPAGSQAPAADRRGPAPSNPGDANVGGERTGPVGNPAGEPAQPVGGSDRAQRPGDGADRSDRVGGEPRGPRAGEPDGNPRTARVAPAAGALAPAENQFQAGYTPRSSRKDAGILIPVNMQQPTQDALSALEDAVGDIDEYARKQLGYKTVDEMHEHLMGLQVDSVASAIYQMSREKGTIIADQTGIGKGRQAAAIIRWAIKNGRIPIFASVKPSLFTDMYGDLHDIGSDDVAPLLMNSIESIKGAGDEKLFANKPAQHKRVLEKIADSGMLPEGRNALFMTYSQINVDNVQRRAVLALAPRAIFILDESHNAGGDSATGEFIKSALDLGKGVVYLSATYAKRPDNMPLYYKTDMGEAVADDATLLAAMEAGGLPLQTVVSNNLVKAGQMFRRERSYDGVEIATVVDSGNRELHEKLSDLTTTALRSITAADRMFHEVFFKSMKKAMEKEGGRALDNAGNQAKASVDHTEFSSIVHNFVKQMLLGLEANKAADMAIAELQNGRKPLIALENTMGSFLKAYVADNRLKVGDSLGTFDYRNVLSRALERTRVYTEVKPNGDEVKVKVPLSALDPITARAYALAQETIDGLKLDIPVSPLDWIRDRITKAGFTVAEITGRKDYIVDYTEPTKPKLIAPDTQEVKDKVATTRRFNSGTLDAIILNVSGSTGISLHASEKFTDRRQRQMIVAQAAGDINVFMQMLGRIHRTGQVALPGYKLLNADLPAVKRPTAVLSKKMKSLNANTSSNTESATSVQAFDMMNKYGDKVVADYLADNPNLARELGLDSGELSDETESDATADIARKMTGRLALMPVATQKAVYDDLEGAYGTLIDYLNKTNQNDLEPRTADFDARELRSEVIFEGQNPATPFGQDAIYNEFSIKAQGKAPTPAEVRADMAEHLGSAKNGDAHARALIESLTPDYKAFYASVGEALQVPADLTAQKGIAFMREHAIGSAFRIEINGEPYAAVVTNLRSTHKSTGNPFSLSKIQVTLAVNGALRGVTVPGSRFGQIETSRVGNYSLDSLFREGPKDERQVAKIITGNLLGAYGELKGVRGTIISFTKEDGTIDQGILLPKAFELSKNTQGDYRLPSGEAALLFLQRSINKDIGRFGISTRDGIVRVTPDGGGIRIQVPKSKAKGGKWFLDEKLRAVVGDFVTSGNNMVATADSNDAAAALDVIMKKQALYTLPSMADEARTIIGPNTKAGTAQYLVNPDVQGQQATVSPTAAAMKRGDTAAAWLAKNGTEPWVREVASKLQPFLGEDTSITFMKAGTSMRLPASVIEVLKRGIFGVSDVDPTTGRVNLYMKWADDRPVGQEDLLHELVHAATQRALSITKSATIRAELESIRAVLLKTFDQVLTSPRASEQARNDAEFFRRVIEDEHELLAYGMTSRTFREWTQQLDATGRFLKVPAMPDQGAAPKLTLWQKFVDVVRSLIGLSKLYQSRLDALLQRRAADRLAFRTANTPETLARRLDQLLQQTLDLKIGADEYNAGWAPRRGSAVASDAAFYSELSRQAERSPMAAAPAQGWRDWIKGLVNKGTVKADEVEWSGFDDWLGTQTGKVTRDAVVAFLDGNGVKVTETALGDQGDRVDTTKYSSYTLPGGENYREVLLTLPVLEGEKDSALRTFQREMIAKYGGINYRDKLTLDEAGKLGRLQGEAARERKKTDTSYRSGHWDQPNVLAHIRLNDRTDSEGRKVLFVEELQSDWQAAIRKQEKAISKAVDTDFEGIVERMKKAGVLEVDCG